MTFGGLGGFKPVGSTDVETAKRLVSMCVQHGVNLIDTANIYSAGLAEEILGQALAGHRDEVYIATKVGLHTGNGPNQGGCSRCYIISQCEESLRRLQTDHIDLYQLHRWDGITALDETLGALADLVHTGKVRYVGCSNYSAWHLMKAIGVAERHRFPRFASQQIHYSLQAREAEYELLPAAVDQRLGSLIWSPLAGGLLSGKYRRHAQAPLGSRHTIGWSEPPVYDRERLYDIIDVLVKIADKREASPARVALAYVLGRPGVTSVVVGARTEEQFLDNLGAAELELEPAELADLDSVSAPPLIYPYWHQAKTLGDRLSSADAVLHGPRSASAEPQ
jgi:aryl-alcohol dehydrogenase-like predicted oxidoreductase